MEIGHNAGLLAAFNRRCACIRSRTRAEIVKSCRAFTSVVVASFVIVSAQPL
jgi:hypothetical protein